MKKIFWIFGFPLLFVLSTAGFWYGFPSLERAGASTGFVGAEQRGSKTQQAMWLSEGKPYTLVLLTVFNPDIAGRQYNSMPLMAKLGINGAKNLSTVCRRLPYVLEATLGALSRSGSDMLDDEGRFRIATQNDNVRDSINRSLGGNACEKSRAGAGNHPRGL